MDNLPSALIGSSGFVGGNLANQHTFDFLYTSKNIEEIRGKAFDVVVCAAAPGVKWKANKEPDNDWAAVGGLIENLKHITARTFILISTVDVYNQPGGVDENTSIITNELLPYGKHRRMLEEFVVEHFGSLIVRLPALFGPGLKKNPLFDLMHGSFDFIDRRMVLQFYNLAYLWSDITKALHNNLSLINLATEPINIKEIAQTVFNLELTKEMSISPASYDIHTKHAMLWGNKQPYAYVKKQILSDIAAFTRENKA